MIGVPVLLQTKIKHCYLLLLESRCNGITINGNDQNHPLILKKEL